MKITITKTQEVKTEINLNPHNFTLSWGTQRDTDSTYFAVCYKGEEIATGHLNNRTNFAHLTMNEGNEENEELENYLTAAIENRTLRT